MAQWECSQHFQISKIDISRHPMDMCMRRAFDWVACAWAGRVYERRLACRRTSHRHPHEWAELIMHSLFYQYPEYRVRHVRRYRAGRCSQPFRSSARRYSPPPPPFRTAIPRLTDWGWRGGKREREKETCKRVETNLWPRHITRAWWRARFEIARPCNNCEH